MKIFQCDSCKVETNDYGHFYNDARPRSMYELELFIDSGKGSSHQGVILCQQCVEKLLYGVGGKEDK